MHQNTETPKKDTHSRFSLLPHWDGDIYTRYAARFYDLTTTVTGWRTKLARHALNDMPPGNLLDVGCGTGYLMSIAQREGFTVTGIDPSEGMLEKALETHHFQAHQLHTVSADELPFDPGTFDVVIASGSLVHIPDISAVAQEIIRVLKPDGRLRIIDHAKPYEKHLSTPWFYVFSQLSGDVLHDYEHFFTSAGGLTLESRKTVGRGGYMQQFDFKKASS